MKILIIPTTDWFKHPTPHRHHYLAEQLKNEHEVFVLHFDIFSKSEGMKPDPAIRYLKAGGSPDENLSKYYIKNWRTHKKRIREIITEEDVDVVFGANLLPTIGAFQEVRRLRKSGKKCLGVYDFSDFFPQSAAIYSKNKMSEKIVNIGSTILLKKNLKMADCVTAVSQPLYDFAKNFSCKRVEMVTNGVELDRFNPDIDSSTIRKKLGLGDSVIGFVGALERWIDLDMPLQSFPSVLDRNPNAQFLIVGGSIKSDYEKRLHRLVKEFGIEKNVIFTGFVPYHDVPKYINAMDITVIPFRTGLHMADIALPDKFFEYMACGKHILSTRLPEVERVAKGSIDIYQNKEDFAEGALRLLGKKGRNEKGLKIVRQYDWKNIADGLAMVFDDCL